MKNHVDEMILSNQQQIREELLKRDDIKAVVLRRRDNNYLYVS
jgi:hypothetical protein